MAKAINLNRNVTGSFGNATFTTNGRHFAIDSHVDAWWMIDINIPETPQNIKSYLEGDDSVSYFAIPSNVTKLCSYALASFPSITTIYITNYESMVDLNAPNVFGGLDNLPTIYVPEKDLSTYQSLYSNYTFATWVQNHDLIIQDGDNNVLTLDTVNAAVYGLSQGTELSITRTFIGEHYTTFEFGAMDFVFDGKVPNSTIELDNEAIFLSSAYNVTQSDIILEVE